MQTVRQTSVKKKRGTHTAPTRGTGIPMNRNRQAHAMTKHSIDIALKISIHLKITSFRAETFCERICYI